jgi:hypothetical protein
MKKIALVLLLLIVPVLVNAENNVQRETVERLLEVMKADKMIDAMYSQMDQMFVGFAKELNVKEDERPIFDKFMSKAVATMKEEMTWEKMKDPMINVYMKHYTETEINDLLVFYSSESGKSIINKIPAVMQDSMLISQSMLKEFMPKLMKMSEELSKDLMTARQAKAAQNPPPKQEEAK